MKHGANRFLLAILLMFGLSLGNFLYQWIFADVPNWRGAFDRSFFQAIAVGLALSLA